MEVLLLVLGAVLGAGLTMATGLLQDWFRRKWDREAARSERSEAAGKLLLPLFDDVAAALARFTNHGDSPEGENHLRLADEIERLAVEIDAQDVRSRVRDIAWAVRRLTTLDNQLGHQASRVGWNVRVCGQNAVGALLGTEKIQPESIIDQYAAAIAEEEALFEAMQLERRRESSRKTKAADDAQ